MAYITDEYFYNNPIPTNQGIAPVPASNQGITPFTPGTSEPSTNDLTRLFNFRPGSDVLSDEDLLRELRSTASPALTNKYGLYNSPSEIMGEPTDEPLVPQTNNTPQTNQPSSFQQFLNDPSLLAGISDMGTNLNRLGRAIGYNPTGENIRNQGQARRGKTLSIIGHTGGALLQGAKNILGGMASQRLYQETMDAYYRQQREAMQNKVEFIGRKGGVIREFANGGVLAELEAGEYIRTPDGQVEQVQGRTHEQGGELYNLEAMTEVTSDNLKIGKAGITQLEKMYPNLKLKLNPTDTYADVIRKAEARIGIPKKDEEILAAQEQLDTLNREDTATYGMNSVFLQKKLETLQQEKQFLEDTRLEFIDVIFGLQESGKRGKTPKTDQFFENGGSVSENQMKIFARKTGYPMSYVQEYFKRKSIPKFDNGGGVAREFELMLNPHRVGADAPGSYTHQSLTPTEVGSPTSGDVTESTFTDRVNTILNLFPKANDYFNIERDKAGTVTKLTFKEADSARHFQKYINRVYDNYEKYAGKHIKDEAQRKEFREAVASFRFDETEKDPVRAFDNIFGNFTSSRSNIALPLVTTSELEALKGKNINNFSQLFGDGVDLKSLSLSDETIKRIEGLKEEFGDDFAPMLMGIPTPTTPSPTAPATTSETPQEKIDPNKGLDNPPNLQTNKAPFRTPYIPNQYRYDYDTVDAHLMVTPRFGRLNPVAVDPTRQIKEVYNAADAGFGKMEGMADAQRLAVTSNIIANSQAAVNQAIADAEAKNTINQYTTDQFNIGQGDKEEAARIGAMMSYEQRQLTADAITRANNFELENYNRRTTIQNYNRVINMRNTHNLFEDYGVDQFGGVYRATQNDKLTLAENIAARQALLSQMEAAQAGITAPTRQHNKTTRTS